MTVIYNDVLERCDILNELIMLDLKSYPLWHVAKLLKKIKVIDNPDDFGWLLIGLFVNPEAKRPDKHFSIAIDIYILLKYSYKRKRLVGRMLYFLKRAYKKDSE